MVIREVEELGVDGLTTQQRAILDFIRGEIAGRGYPPTVREICEHFGFSSPNGATFHLKVLERKGAIRRDRGTARGIRPVGGPTGGLHLDGAGLVGLIRRMQSLGFAPAWGSYGLVGIDAEELAAAMLDPDAAGSWAVQAMRCDDEGRPRPDFPRLEVA